MFWLTMTSNFKEEKKIFNRFEAFDYEPLAFSDEEKETDEADVYELI